MTRGRIYGYRFRPPGSIKGRAVDEYKGRCIEGKAFQVMIDNNLDFDVALYPYEQVHRSGSDQGNYLSLFEKINKTEPFKSLEDHF